MYQYTFRKAFMSDPATYPLVVVMAAAMSFVTGMSINALSHYKDLRIRPEYKHQELQNWGYEHRDSVTKRLALKPHTLYNEGMLAVRQEGLGVDHEEWKKSKGL